MVETSQQRPIPMAALVSGEATFEAHLDRRQGYDGIILVMRPHGVPINDEREQGWVLTWAEVAGLRQLLVECDDVVVS